MPESHMGQVASPATGPPADCEPTAIAPLPAGEGRTGGLTPLRLPPIRRPAVVAAKLNIKGFWNLYGEFFLDVVPLVIVALLVLYALIIERSLEQLALAAGGAALVLGIRAALRPGAVIAPLALAKSLTDAGWTGETASRRLLDAATQALGEVRGRGVPNPFQPLEPTPKLEVPGFKLDADQFGDVLRELLGARRPRVGGEIVAGQDGLLTLRLRGIFGSLLVDKGPIPLSELDIVVQAAAIEMLLRAAPYNLAYAWRDRNEYAKALDALSEGVRGAAYSPRVRARCEVLRWHILTTLGQFDSAADALSQAAALAGPADLVVALAVGYQLEADAAAPNAAEQNWIRLGRLASRWARGDEDLSRWSMSEARFQGAVVQIHRESAARLEAGAKRWLVEAENACWELERDRLHPRTTAVELGSAALKVDGFIKYADQQLASARREDPDGHLAAEIDRLEQERARIGKIREELTDDRVRQGLRWIEHRRSEIDDWSTRMGDIADDASAGLQQLESDFREPFGPKTILLGFQGCFAILKDYRRSQREGNAIGDLYFYRAADRVLELSGTLETIAATPFALRDRRLELRSRLKAIESCGRWLLAHAPTGEPDLLGAPENDAPAQPTGPGVKASPVMSKLRELRNERARAARLSR